ncbi:MAG: prepilin peptidase [Planctomycetota bacterium]
MSPPPLVALPALALLLIAVAHDLRSRTIPDAVSVALVALAAVATSCGWHDVSWSALLGGAASAFALGAALFYLGAMGGGDAKLCAGIGALCGWPKAFEVLFATALWGGVVSLIAKRRGATAVPYAPAIAAGYVTTVAVRWSAPPRAGLWDWITGVSL